MPPLMWQAERRPGALRGPHRHRRALAEGAVEQQPFGRRRCKFVQHAAGLDIFHQVGVGRVQRARNDAVLLALAVFAQIDEGDVRLAEISQARSSAAMVHSRWAMSSCAMPTCMFAGTATSIIFGLASFRLLIRSTYSSTDLTLQARIAGAFFRDGRNRVAFVVVRRETPASRPAAAAVC